MRLFWGIFKHCVIHAKCCFPISFDSISDKWFFVSDFCMKTETFPRVSLPVDVGQENAWAADAELGYAAEEDFWVLRELCKFACSVRL